MSITEIAVPDPVVRWVSLERESFVTQPVCTMEHLIECLIRPWDGFGGPSGASRHTPEQDDLGFTASSADSSAGARNRQGV